MALVALPLFRRARVSVGEVGGFLLADFARSCHALLLLHGSYLINDTLSTGDPLDKLYVFALPYSLSPLRALIFPIFPCAPKMPRIVIFAGIPSPRFPLHFSAPLPSELISLFHFLREDVVFF